MGEPTEALEFAVEALYARDDVQLGLNRDAAATLKRHLDLALLASPEPSPEIYWTFGHTYYGEYPDKDAAIFARAVLRLWPNTAFAEALAAFALHSVDADQAVAHYERALELDPKLESLRPRVAALHFAAGRHDVAQKEFERTLETNPRQVAALEGIAFVLEADGQVDAAIDKMDEALSAADGSDAWVRSKTLVAMCRRHGRLEDALPRLRRHCERITDLAPLHIECANLEVELRDYDSARKRLERYVAKNRPSASIHNTLGAIAMRQSNFALAASELRKAHAIRKDEPVVMYNLVKALEKSGELDEALEVAREVVKFTGWRKPLYIGLLASVEKVRGELDRAQRHVEMALELLEIEPAASATLRAHLIRLRRSIRRARRN